MDSITLKVVVTPLLPPISQINSINKLSLKTHNLLSPICFKPFTRITLKRPCLANKRNPQPDPILEPSLVRQVSTEDDDEFLVDDFDDGNCPYPLIIKLLIYIWLLPLFNYICLFVYLFI